MVHRTIELALSMGNLQAPAFASSDLTTWLAALRIWQRYFAKQEGFGCWAFGCTGWAACPAQPMAEVTGGEQNWPSSSATSGPKDRKKVIELDATP